MAGIDKSGIKWLKNFGMDLIRSLGNEALTFYGKGKTSLKFDEELVTAAELQLNATFRERLLEEFPEHQIFSNSQDNHGYTHDEKRYLWIFDPVDGVDNFQTGIPIWGTSLALLENFWPIFSVFFMPATGDLFHAGAGKEAYHNDKKMIVSTHKGINDESLLLTYSRFHLDYHSRFPGKVRNLGCATAHICYVAMGRADAAIIANESYQGLSAARVIIESAGAKIFNMDGSGFFLNEYLDGQKISDHLLVVAPDNFSTVLSSFTKAA